MEASTRQPAGERETSAAATGMAMATGNATHRHHGLVATALVLAAEAAAALIVDDADGGNSVAIVGRASLTAGGGLIIKSIVYL